MGGALQGAVGCWEVRSHPGLHPHSREALGRLGLSAVLLSVWGSYMSSPWAKVWLWPQEASEGLGGHVGALITSQLGDPKQLKSPPL